MVINNHPGVVTSPEYASEFLRFMNPLLDALREKGGQARPREIYELIAQNLTLSPEERSETLKSGAVKFENQLAWARSYLVKTGYMDSAAHGVWRLTEKGASAHLDGPDIDAIFARVQEEKSLSKAVNNVSKSQAPNQESMIDPVEEEAIAPSPQTSPYSDHLPALVTLICNMSPRGFEEFCSELLSRVGVEDVQTTSYSKDRGIDGTGRLRINEFVFQPIAFQAKKFDGSGRKVTSEEVQRFRGAIGSHIARGIFLRPPAIPRMQNSKQRRRARSRSNLSI